MLDHLVVVPDHLLGFDLHPGFQYMPVLPACLYPVFSLFVSIERGQYGIIQLDTMHVSTCNRKVDSIKETS